MSVYLHGGQVLLDSGLIAISENCCCTEENGGCCFDDGTCSVLTESDCINAGGTFLGDGTTCSPNPCGTGACCIGESCSITSESDCINSGGIYQGDNTTCSPNPCTGCTQCDGILIEYPYGGISESQTCIRHGIIYCHLEVTMEWNLEGHRVIAPGCTVLSQLSGSFTKVSDCNSGASCDGTILSARQFITGDPCDPTGIACPPDGTNACSVENYNPCTTPFPQFFCMPGSCGYVFFIAGVPSSPTSTPIDTDTELKHEYTSPDGEGTLSIHWVWSNPCI